jgi:hypothetical protein
MLSHALQASFADAREQRTTHRRILRLEALAATAAGEGGIEIHNLSRTGMLVGSASEIELGTALEVEMPGGSRHRAEVVWQDAGLFGCRFSKPLSQATLSAALLRAAPAAASVANSPPRQETAALHRLREHWSFEHEADEVQEPKLPPGKRLWAILGLAVAAWVVPAGLLAAALS